MAEESLSAYTVLLTVYAGDEPDEFETALRSCLDQTHPPAELLVVADGPLTDPLEAVLDSYLKEYPDVVSLHQLPENNGRGEAARIGITQCRHELVGIMSADDISVPDRFERQVAYLDAHPEVDVIGGYVLEFTDDPDVIDSVRTVPTDPDEIARLAKFRCPMNEVSTMFRREEVLSVGNYRSLNRMEDYDLWVRLLQDGATLANVPEVLVKMRAGEAMFARRGGLEYAREEFRQQAALIRMGFVSVPRALLNLALRVPVRLLPNRLRMAIYTRLLRDDPQ
jgi:glycosyltransferase involved in cell wall biosynthesis